MQDWELDLEKAEQEIDRLKNLLVKLAADKAKAENDNYDLKQAIHKIYTVSRRVMVGD
jgi:hypothetical protein